MKIRQLVLMNSIT